MCQKMIDELQTMQTISSGLSVLYGIHSFGSIVPCNTEKSVHPGYQRNRNTVDSRYLEFAYLE